jgi:hypothetical protein
LLKLARKVQPVKIDESVISVGLARRDLSRRHAANAKIRRGKK